MSGSLTFLGTATVLVEHGGFRVPTDPNFLHRGDWAYLGKGLVSRRRTEPAMRIEDLPPLDAVVLSHLHGDHFDRVARRGLAQDVQVLTTPASARTLRRWGFSRAVGLRTWQSYELRSAAGDVLTVTAAPGTHAKGLVKALLPPVMGSVWEFAPAGRERLSMYVTGDTLRVADLLDRVRPRTTVPVHHDDDGVFRSPLSDFLAEVERRGLPGVRPLRSGERLALPPG